MGKIVFVSATPLEHGGLKDLNGLPIYQIGIGKTNANEYGGCYSQGKS